MAAGDRDVFDYFLENVFDGGIHVFGGSPNTIKCAIVDNTLTPVATATDPCWGAGGTVDYSANEVTGTNYPAGGQTCATPSATLNGSVLEIDFGDPAVWTATAGNPTTGYWAIIYDDTATNKNCLGFVDLGGPIDGTVEDIDLNWGTPFATVTKA